MLCRTAGFPQHLAGCSEGLSGSVHDQRAVNVVVIKVCPFTIVASPNLSS